MNQLIFIEKKNRLDLVKMEKILITGGAGFIGSNFIKLLAKKQPQAKIINFDKLSYAGNLNNLKELKENKNHEFVKADILNSKAVEKSMKNCDAVIHFAAETHVDRSLLDAGSFVKTDVLGTWNLLEAARKLDVKKFIQISTDEVYGSIEKGKSRETDELKPRNPYSASKAGAERLAYSYFATYGLPVIITRSSNNFGPNQFPEKLVPLFITNLLENKKVPVYGNGLNKRDWLFVEDNCNAIEMLLHKGKNGEVYNIGAGNEKTNLEITEFILRELGKGKESMEFVEDRKGHDKRYALDVSKISQIGWKQKYSFDYAMRHTIQWYKQNSWWWKPLKKKAGLKKK